MGLWWELEIDLLIGIREGFSGEVIFVLNFEREIYIHDRSKVRGHFRQSKPQEQGVKTAKYMAYLSVTNSIGCRVWAQVESEPRYGFSVLQCRYIPTVRNI